MAIFSSRQSTHLFEVLVYAGADLTIFQDISGICLILSLQSHTYFESAVLCTVIKCTDILFYVPPISQYKR